MVMSQQQQQEIQNPLTLSESEETCNGLVSNCKMRVNELLFPMVHNAMSSQANNFVAYNNLGSLEVRFHFQNKHTLKKELFFVVVVEKVPSTMYSAVLSLGLGCERYLSTQRQREREFVAAAQNSSSGSKQNSLKATDVMIDIVASIYFYWIPSRRRRRHLSSSNSSLNVSLLFSLLYYSFLPRYIYIRIH